MKKEIKGENVTNKNLVTIKIKQRKEPITGLYVNHDNNWVAVLENTYDYVLDGYTFINREWIDHFHIETDRIADYIFSNSKWELINSTLLFPPALFDKDKEKLVEIWQHKAHKFWLGEIKNINEQYITMRILDKQAQWIGYKKFPLQKIRFFRVNTRYSCAYQKYITTDSTKIPRLEIWEIKVNNHNEIYKGGISKENIEKENEFKKSLDVVGQEEEPNEVSKEFANKLGVDEKNIVSTDRISAKILSLNYSPMWKYEGKGIDCTNTMHIFSTFMEKKENIAIGLESDDYILVGKISKINRKSIVLNKIDEQTNFIQSQRIPFSKIRLIEYKNNYLTSLSKYENLFASID